MGGNGGCCKNSWPPPQAMATLVAPENATRALGATSLAGGGHASRMVPSPEESKGGRGGAAPGGVPNTHPPRDTTSFTFTL